MPLSTAFLTAKHEQGAAPTDDSTHVTIMQQDLCVMQSDSPRPKTDKASPVVRLSLPS